MNDQTTVVLFTGNPVLAPLGPALRAQGLHVLRARSDEEGRQALAACRGRCVVVLDATQPVGYSYRGASRLLCDPPAVPSLVLVDIDHVGAADLWRKGPETFDYAHLPTPIEALLLRVRALCLRAGLPLPEPTAAAAPPEHGTIVVMFGAKGGIGRSMIAANLAVGLTQHFGYKVALLDADLWYSAQRALLDLDSTKSIADLTHLEDPLDMDALRDALVPHSSGARVLLAPEEPWLVETIPADLPARLARAYCTQFDFVIVDTHPSTEEYVLQLLDAADRILMVTTPEVGPLRRSLEMLKLAPGLGWRDKMLLVLNRAGTGMTQDQIEATLDMRVDASIVSSGRLAVASANQGVPLLLLDPTGQEQITRDVRRLVSYIAGEPDTPWERLPARRSLLPFWRSWWAARRHTQPA